MNMKEQALKRFVEQTPRELIDKLINHLYEQEDEELKEFIPYLLLLL